MAKEKTPEYQDVTVRRGKENTMLGQLKVKPPKGGIDGSFSKEM